MGRAIVYNINDDGDDFTMTMNGFREREHCLFWAFFFNLLSKHTHTLPRSLSSLCLCFGSTIFSTGICESTTLHWIRNLFLRWNLFRYDFSMDFILFSNVIFVGTAGANVALVCAALYCSMFIDFTSFVLFFLPLPFRHSIDLNERTSGNVHILTF